MHRKQFLSAAAGAVVGGTLGYSIAGMSDADAGARVHDPVASDPDREPRAVPPEPHLVDAAMFHASRRFARTEHGRIAYIERGSGRAALFLHGLPLNGFQWRGALERLWPHRRCIAPDFMGLGYSDVPEGQSLSPAAQTAMLGAFLDALGIDSVDIVASDSGNTVAQLFMVRHPDRVRTLLLTNGDADDHSPPPVLMPVIAASQEGTFVDDVLVPQLEDPALAHLPTGLGGLCYTDPAFVTAELLEVYTRPLVESAARKAQFHRFCVELEPNPLPPIESDLARSQVPARVIWGTGDPLFPTRLAEWLDATLPGSRGVRWVEGARLFFPEEMPNLIAEEARRLWGEG